MQTVLQQLLLELQRLLHVLQRQAEATMLRLVFQAVRHVQVLRLQERPLLQAGVIQPLHVRQVLRHRAARVLRVHVQQLQVLRALRQLRLFRRQVVQAV